MTYTIEQKKAAAKVTGLPWHEQNGRIWLNGAWWQPWADTEAGRSDALVLLAAVVSRFHVMDGPTFHRLAHHEGYLNDALRSGDVQQIQAATFAAAIAIGQHMEQSNEN